MIAQLSGTLVLKQPNTAVIDVNGVGYEVTIPVSTFYVLGEVGSPVTIRIHTHVREDAFQLFGFHSAQDKDLFLKLTSVSGVGPKLAITMLSGMASPDLITAIRSSDLARLTTIPGVGRKTAERVVVELRDKLAAPVEPPAEAATKPGAEPVVVPRIDVRDDTIAALMQLGYPRPQAERAVNEAVRQDGESTIEAVLRRSLKLLSR